MYAIAILPFDCTYTIHYIVACREIPNTFSVNFSNL